MIKKAAKRIRDMSDEELQKAWEEYEKTYVSDPVFVEWIENALRESNEEDFD